MTLLRDGLKLGIGYAALTKVVGAMDKHDERNNASHQQQQPVYQQQPQQQQQYQQGYNQGAAPPYSRGDNNHSGPMQHASYCNGQCGGQCSGGNGAWRDQK